jgi:hypothetical protein
MRKRGGWAEAHGERVARRLMGATGVADMDYVTRPESDLALRSEAARLRVLEFAMEGDFKKAHRETHRFLLRNNVPGWAAYSQRLLRAADEFGHGTREWQKTALRVALDILGNPRGRYYAEVELAEIRGLVKRVMAHARESARKGDRTEDHLLVSRLGCLLNKDEYRECTGEYADEEESDDEI